MLKYIPTREPVQKLRFMAFMAKSQFRLDRGISSSVHGDWAIASDCDDDCDCGAGGDGHRDGGGDGGDESLGTGTESASVEIGDLVLALVPHEGADERASYRGGLATAQGVAAEGSSGTSGQGAR
ncbi:hypothetical protein PG993_009846 [Apiospora rasikravindrae]|uniref:Uncharacterized protein n=1 Tax=Apiospora rasikravindrae TaxID=990691 RepID=A0ABR1SLX0_9PEZI